jgi:hypothetical protein
VTLSLRENAELLNLGSRFFIDISGGFQNGYIVMTSTNVLTMECGQGTQHWVLWNYATGAIVAQGDACPQSCMAGFPGGLAPNVQLAASIAVVPYVSPYAPGPVGFQTISTSDGSVLSTVTPANSLNWWKAASDGSYVCGAVATSGNLTAWAPDGSVLMTRTGNYSGASAYCAPGQMLVAKGPAGADVIEKITVPAGASSVGPAFAGTFHSWFLDGSAFLTSVGTTVWVYTPAGAQLDFRSLSINSPQGLAGEGEWFWAGDGTNLYIYKVGASATPTATFPSAAGVTPSGLTIGIASPFQIVDLSGATPAAVSYSPPVSGIYAAASASAWVIGSGPDGRLLDGASLATTPRYFGYGALNSIAGSQARLAVATAGGQILVYNANDFSLEATLNVSAQQLSISADGTALAVLTYAPGGNSVSALSLPTGSVINTWTYPGNNPGPVGITLSSSGALLGQVLSSYTRQVTASTGDALLWSDSGGQLPVLFSLDDTLIATSDGTNTAIYLNYVKSSAVAGVAAGWLQGNELVVNAANAGAIYDSQGVRQSEPALPYIYGPIEPLSASSFYDGGNNRIYSQTSGMATWTPPATAERRGTVAGTSVAFTTSGDQLVTEPYSDSRTARCYCTASDFRVRTAPVTWGEHAAAFSSRHISNC